MSFSQIDVKGMEEDDRLKRTIECLRGRLVAERQHSRSAKKDADRLCDKLTELENKLKEEMKMKNRAEKKLRFLEGKLESVKIAGRSSEDSERQSSPSVSENSLVSCRSSAMNSATSGSIQQRQGQMFSSQIRNEVMLVNLDSIATEIAEPNLKDGSSSSGDDHRSSITEISREECHEKLGSPLEGFQLTDYRKVSEEDEDEEVDNSLALVPVDSVVPEKAQARELKMVNRSVSEVLEALRLAREGIQRRMRQKQNHMIKLARTPAQAC